MLNGLFRTVTSISSMSSFHWIKTDWVKKKKNQVHRHTKTLSIHNIAVEPILTQEQIQIFRLGQRCPILVLGIHHSAEFNSKSNTPGLERFRGVTFNITLHNINLRDTFIQSDIQFEETVKGLIWILVPGVLD